MFIYLLQNGIGRNFDDLKYQFTIDQIYLYSEKCRITELRSQKLTAITLAQALIYNSESADKSDSIKKQRMWDKFINSFNVNNKKTEKQDVGKLLQTFGKMGIKVNIKE